MGLLTTIKNMTKTQDENIKYIDTARWQAPQITLDNLAPMVALDSLPREVSSLAFNNHSAWQNSVASVGVNNSLQQHSHHILNRLSYQECANLATDSMISKAIDTIVREIFKPGGKWADTHLDIDSFEMILNSLGFYQKVQLATQRALEYGGAFIYINTDDNDLSLPLYLNERTAQENKITGLTVIEPWQVAPVQVNSFNPLKKDYVNPTLWYVMGASTQVHRTRLIPIVFYSVPDLIKPLFNYLGLPLAFYMKNYVANAETVRQSISELVLRFRTKIIKTTSQNIADPSAQARVKFINSLMNNFSTLFLSKNEEWIESATSLSGLDNILSQMYELLTASTRGIPVTKLLGLSPRGFNATGEYDENNFYDVVDGYSKTIVIPAMEKLAEYILCFKAGVLSEPKFEFKPRKQIKEKEQAEINNLKADYISKLITAGVITAKDAIKAISEDNFKFDWIDYEDYQAPENPEVELDIFQKWQDENSNNKKFDESKIKRDENGQFAEQNSNSETSKEEKKEEKKQEKKTLVNNAPRPKAWGDPNTDFIGDPAGAVNYLLEKQEGYVPEAAYKEGVGYIDFVWGNEKYGLAHIIAERKKQELDGIEVIKKIPTIIKKGTIQKNKIKQGKTKQSKKNRIVIRYQVSKNEGHEVVITKTSGVNWVLTGYQLYRTLPAKARKIAMAAKRKK